MRQSLSGIPQCRPETCILVTDPGPKLADFAPAGWHASCCIPDELITRESVMIEITQPAQEAIKAAIANAGQPVAGLRLLVETGGRAGPTYGMLVERKADPADETLTFGDVTLLIDPETRPHLAGTKVDFVASVAGACFVFEKSIC